MLLGGDFFLGGVVAVTLAKLVLRLRPLAFVPPSAVNRTAADAMLVGRMTCLAISIQKSSCCAVVARVKLTAGVCR